MTHVPVLSAAPFTIARRWKQSKYPLIGDWIKKMRYIYMTDYYSARKRNETGSFVEIWMCIESGIETEANQKEKNKSCALMYTCGI